MRESIGASWLLGVVLVFIAFFSGYLAFSINYSKAFKVKDAIVDRIEKHNGPNEESVKDINEYLSEIGYNTKGDCSRLEAENGTNFIGVTNDAVTKDPSGGKYHYCIQKVDAGASGNQMKSSYYKVVVFFSFSLPFLDNFANFYVTGETKSIYYPNDQWMEG